MRENGINKKPISPVEDITKIKGALISKIGALNHEIILINIKISESADPDEKDAMGEKLSDKRARLLKQLEGNMEKWKENKI